MSPIGRSASKGFTALELVLVVVLLSLVLFLSLPRLYDVTAGRKLEKAARKMVATIRYARGVAAGTGEIHLLHMDIGTGRYWLSREHAPEEAIPEKEEVLERFTLPASVLFADVETLGAGVVKSGNASIRFFQSGLVETAHIHLKDESNGVLTLILNPVTGSVKVAKEYVVQTKL